jgi:hypothetical protein
MRTIVNGQVDSATPTQTFEQEQPSVPRLGNRHSG